jgi:hypothetical protein
MSGNPKLNHWQEVQMSDYLNRLHKERGEMVSMAREARILHGVTSAQFQALWADVEHHTYLIGCEEREAAERGEFRTPVYSYIDDYQIPSFDSKQLIANRKHDFATGVTVLCVLALIVASVGWCVYLAACKWPAVGDALAVVGWAWIMLGASGAILHGVKNGKDQA